VSGMDEPINFLIVDDLEENLVSLEALLQRDGLAFLKARSGEEALEILLKHDVALALLDVQMPGIDGFQLAEFMRGNERARHIPIIFLTAGTADTKRRFRGYEAGAVDFIHKPIEVDILRSKADVFFNLHQQRRQIQVQRDALEVSTKALAAAANHLEEQVRERTAELGAANAALKGELETREAAEAQVRQMQKMESIGQLTGGIAHDFNNMLAIVIGSLDIAKRRLDSDRARALVCIDNALEGARRAALLTARLLAFSSQLPLAPRALDVDQLVGGMSELLRQTIGEHLRVETVMAGGLWRAFVDPGQLENAILNLVINARDAMPNGGRLTVETSNAHLDDAYAEAVAGQYVLISVTDSGTGIPADVIARVFDPFFTTKGVGKGTGLGLSQVHGFVKQSGGSVKVYSEPGRGTTVNLYLPRYVGAETGLDCETPALSAESARAKDGEVILVVEDDEKIRFLSVEALRDFGYTVVQAGDASQALAVLAVQPRVDLLFTDIVMPDVNGRQLADKARESRPDLKVLYTSGFTKNAVVHNGVLDPGVALISKPFTIDDLAIKVRLVLDGGGVNRPG